MEAVVVALLLLLGMLVRAGLELALSPRLGVSVPVRLALSVLMGALGLATVVMLAWEVLPGSVLSQGWTREMLDRAQQAAAGLALLIAVLGTWRVHAGLHALRQ